MLTNDFCFITRFWDFIKKKKDSKMVNVVTPFNSQKWDLNSKEGSSIKRSLTLKAKVSLLIAVVLIAMVIVIVVVCLFIPWGQTDSIWPTYESNSRLGKFEKAAVSTDSAPCAPIGRNILERNGSAVDAAIATLVCMGVHTPHSNGLGGGFLMLYYNRSEGKVHYIDAREVAPRKANQYMFDGDANKAAIGPLSMAVPGELAGYWDAHRRFGRLPWNQLFKPTIDICRNGIEVSSHLARAIRVKKENLVKFEHIRNIFLKNNGTEGYEAGEYIKRPDLAKTLEVIAEKNVAALYGPSDLFNSFLKDLKEAGSIIDKTDLESYTTRFRKPAEVKLRGNTTLYSTSIPGSGALLAFMMNVIDGYPDIDKSVIKDSKKAALTYHRIVEAFKFAYAHRSQMQDEEESQYEGMEKLALKLTSKAYAEEIRRRINDTRTYPSVSDYGGDFFFKEDHGTAHLSLIAPNGDAVAATTTINQYFGSMIVSPSTGIILNDEMDDFSSPNINNSFGIPPTENNHVRPGMRPLSSMAPTILLDSEGNAKLVLGGNGGTTITTGIFQTAARALFFDEDIKQSIDAPRIHHQLLPNVLEYEKTFPQGMVDELAKFGHEVKPWNSGMMSIIMGVMRGDDGFLYANSDYRKGGEVDGY